MPSLSLNTSRDDLASKPTSSESGSPSRPPYSPITPTLGSSRSATNSLPPQRFTHTQGPQVAIMPPDPQPIDFSENADVLALKSTMSILQMQKATALRDIKTLQRMKELALENPEEFVKALNSGRIRTRPDQLFQPSKSHHERDGDESLGSDSRGSPQSATVTWELLPIPQNIVRTPPINFAQYAVVSESLDKLHSDQIARPTEGCPQRLGPGGVYISIGEGEQRQYDMGVAAPYNPLKDKNLRAGTSKGGGR
ncbi:unnamed protein product [Blumeria hordei]|uniref:Uncharacterized protein n=1 Tax=Blumeria hordei TaxID=2867405 RepID=A0A383UP51_BLUHO|nr:unnamed protein product [Blumeria hordei]